MQAAVFPFIFMFALPADAFACERSTEPQPITIIWRSENTAEVSLINRADNEDSPIFIIVNIDGKKTQKMGPFNKRYGTHDFKLDGLSPSAHTFTFQSVSGRTGCVPEETKPEKLESWDQHAHRGPIEDIVSPFSYDSGPPPH